MFTNAICYRIFMENAFYGLFKFTKNDPSFVQFLKFEQAET